MVTAIDYLISAQNITGGWGYTTGQRSVVEPTAAVLIVLGSELGAGEASQKGISWLLRCQHQDGGWGIHEDDHESGWHTAWALLAIKNLNGKDEVKQKSVEWLTNESTSQITQEEFIAQNLPATIDTGGLVWPWLPGQVCWIEPTALTVFALAGQNLDLVAEKRINAARDYFSSNRTPTGGWDIGNAGPLDSIVIPRSYPTSLVLMALASTAATEIQDIDKAGLRGDMEGDASILSQACGLLALKICGDMNKEAESKILFTQKPNGSWENNPFFTAWAMLALRGKF